ncbi:MAG: GntR family transcriptional regulator [Solobacterium sp.]|nr:GntR family transcriptional regulator [Solobacterium sp.]
MNIRINNRSGQPIYEQIFSEIRDAIVRGELKENTPLPSIRLLAKDLRISVITTKRAYEELEREGFIYTLPAKGSFVAERDPQLVREVYLRQIEEHLEEVRKLAGAAGLSESETADILHMLWREEE